MPQMSPMWWMSLMIMFNIYFLLINSMTFFSYPIKKSKFKKLKMNKMNWKW